VTLAFLNRPSVINFTSQGASVLVRVNYVNCKASDYVQMQAGLLNQESTNGYKVVKSYPYSVSDKKYANGFQVRVNLPADIDRRKCLPKSDYWICNAFIIGYSSRSGSNVSVDSSGGTEIDWGESFKLSFSYNITESHFKDLKNTYGTFQFLPVEPTSPTQTDPGSSASSETKKAEDAKGIEDRQDFNKLPNPLGGLGINDTTDVIDKITNIVMIIAVPFVTIMIMYAGFKYVVAYGNPTKVKEAHQRALWTVVGTILLFGAATFGSLLIKTVQKVTTDGLPQSEVNTGQSQNNESKTTSPKGSNTQTTPSASKTTPTSGSSSGSNAGPSGGNTSSGGQSSNTNQGNASSSVSDIINRISSADSSIISDNLGRDFYKLKLVFSPSRIPNTNEGNVVFNIVIRYNNAQGQIIKETNTQIYNWTGSSYEITSINLTRNELINFNKDVDTKETKIYIEISNALDRAKKSSTTLTLEPLTP